VSGPFREGPFILTGAKLGSYEILERLGGGGMGVVYRARDTILGRPVAVKVLKSGDASSVRLQRFFREARAASALNHPNIVTIYEFGSENEIAFMAMEIVEGQTLRDMASRPVEIGSLRAVLAQAAKALAAAHAAGLVHRDVKPENIMVRADGYVKVLDFGIAKRFLNPEGQETVTSAPTIEGSLVGTVRYMSPEQILGLALSGASDVFSLGVVLYELATGSHPFPAATFGAAMKAILDTTPAAPSDLNPAIPRDLEMLMMGMLDKDPAHRPSADDVVAALSDSSGHVPLQSKPAAARSKVVGRDSQKAQLRAALDRAASGRGVLAAIRGEAGLGKTTLVEEFLAQTKGCLIARGRCAERLAGAEAYLPVFEALSDLLRSTFASITARLMKQTAPTWFLQVSSLTTGDSIIAPSEVEEKTANSQERLKREFVAYLENLTKVHPVVLFLEDLHWADLSTVDLLSYLGSRCGDLRLLVIVTYRPSAIQAASHPFRSVQLEMQSHDLAFEVNLDYLDRQSVEQYLAREFEGHEFPADFVQLVHARTEGHPLFMADLLRDLKIRGIVTGASGNWKLAANLKDIAHDMPVSTRSMIERTIEHLPEEDRQVLRAGALQGAEFDSSVVCHVLSRGEDEIEDRLERISKTQGLIELVSEKEFPDGTLTLRYRFSHALYQNALTESLALTRRSRWSLQIARRLEALYRDETADYASQLAFLFEQGRDLSVASGYYYSAAVNAARVFAGREVAVLARRGLDCLQRLPESGERAAREITLSLLLGSALTQTRGFGDPEVLQVYDEATALCQSHGVPAQQSNAMRGLWAFHLVRAEYRKAHSLARLLTELANRTDDPVARVEACLAAGFTEGYLGNAASSAENFRTALGIEVPRTRTERTFMFALDNAVACRTQLATQLWYLGYPEQALDEARRAHQQATAIRAPYDTGFTMMQCATVHRLRREYTQTSREAAAALKYATEYGLREIMGWSLMHLGWSLVFLGQAEEGIARMKKCLQAQASAGSLIARGNFVAELVEGLLEVGKVDEALDHLDAGIRAAEQHGEGYYQAEMLRFQGEALIRKSRLDDAERTLRLALTKASAAQTRGWELRAAASLCRLLTATGRAAEGRAVLTPVYEWFTEGRETRDLIECGTLLTAGTAA